MTSIIVQEARISQAPFVNNLLINPGFEIWQRGNGPFTSNPGFSTDEWKIYATGTPSVSVSRNSASKFGEYCADVSVSGFVGAWFQQGIERGFSLEGLWVTLSMWVKCSKEDSVRIGISDYVSSFEREESSYHTGSGDWEQLTVSKKIRSSLNSPAGVYPHSFPIVVGVDFSVDVSNVLVDGAMLVLGYYPEGIPFVPPNP